MNTPGKEWQRGRASLLSGVTAFAIGLGAATVINAAPITANFEATNPALVFGSDFVSQVADGVTITARAYTVEFNGLNTTIYGPFPTSNGFGGNQIFGTVTSGLSMQPGLGLLTQPLPGINTTGRDFGGAVYEPGFDNGVYLGDNPDIPGSPLPKMEFALFSFSSSVDISQVTVDDVVNNPRAIWAAGGTSTPDFSSGLLAALSGFSVQNSVDDASDGPFTHVLDNFSSISILAVGAPTPSSVGAFGPIASTDGARFYITGFTFEPSQNGGDNGPAVPEPTTLGLLALGLGVLGFARRQRNRSSHR